MELCYDHYDRLWEDMICLKEEQPWMKLSEDLKGGG